MADKAFIEFDEARLRDDMRVDIRGEVDGQKSILKTTLKQEQSAALLQMTAALNASLKGAFLPIRDGL